MCLQCANPNRSCHVSKNIKLIYAGTGHFILLANFFNRDTVTSFSLSLCLLCMSVAIVCFCNILLICADEISIITIPLITPIVHELSFPNVKDEKPISHNAKIRINGSRQ
jgi:hypothetical protein